MSPQRLRRFEEFLQIRGTRMTEQRKVLLQHVFERHQHFDVDELIEQLPKGGEATVSRPTVYARSTNLSTRGC